MICSLLKLPEEIQNALREGAIGVSQGYIFAAKSAVKLGCDPGEVGCEVREDRPVSLPAVDQQVDVQPLELLPEGIFRGAGEGEEEQRMPRQTQAVQEELRRPRVDPGQGHLRPDLKDGPDAAFPVHHQQVAAAVVSGPEAMSFQRLGEIPDDQAVVAFGAGLPFLFAAAGADEILAQRQFVEAQLRLRGTGGGRLLDPVDLPDELGDLPGEARRVQNPDDGDGRFLAAVVHHLPDPPVTVFEEAFSDPLPPAS